MADMQPKRLREVAARLRVEPGRKVRLGPRLRPRLPVPSRPGRQGGAEAAPGAGHRAARRVPDAPGRPGHLRGRRRPPGHGRRRQGRHHPPRHERRQPAGRRGPQLQDPLVGGARPRLPLALPATPARARPHRHLQPLALRGGPRRARPPTDPAGPEAAAVVQAGRRLEAALPGDQRLGALPDRQRLPLREDLPEPQPRGAAPTVPGPHRRAREELEVLRQRRQGAGLLGRLPAGLQRGAQQHEHRVGALARHPGRRQAVRPRRRRRRPRRHAHRHRPQVPQGLDGGQGGPPGRQGRSRGPGAEGRGARPDRGRAGRGQGQEGRKKAKRKGKKS